MPKHTGRYDTAYIALKALRNAHKATFKHCTRTSKIALSIAAKMKHKLYLTSNGEHIITPNDVRKAALFHDIGKLFVPMHILKKSGKLTVLEREHVLPHPVWGEQILLSSTEHRVRTWPGLSVSTMNYRMVRVPVKAYPG